MALSYVSYTANGSTNQFAVTFNYIQQADVHVYLNGVEDNSFTFVNDALIQTSSTPANGVVVKVARQTSTTARTVDFQDGSVLTESDLDTSANQNFFTVQENFDRTQDTIQLTNSNVWDATSKRITNVTNPTSNQDAVTKHYLENTWLSTSDKANITTVAGISSNISALGTADVISDMNVLATSDIISDMNTLATADIVSDMNTLATSDVVADMNTLAVSDVINDMNVLATSDVVADMNTLGTADVVSDMNTLGTSSNVTNMNTLAGISSNITTVAGISSNVTTVANANSNIASVVSNASNINTVAGISSNVTSVAGISTAISNVNSNSSNINAVNSNASNINTVAGANTNISTVASAITNINTVAGANSNISTVAGANTNITTVASNISGVNSFADRYRVSSSDPSSSLDAGDLVYNSSSNQVKYYNGSSWVAISSDTDVKTLVSANDTTAGFLNGKLVAGSNITFTEANDGGNETLTIAGVDNSIPFAIALG